MNIYPYLPRTSLFLLASLAVSPVALAQNESSAVLALWTFEEWTENLEGKSQTIGPISPEFGNGSATGWHADDANWSTPLGNGSDTAWNSSNWTEGDYYQFEASTIGFSSLQLDWDMTRSGTGPEEDWTLLYSNDGDNFITHEAFALGTESWGSGSVSSASRYSSDLNGIIDVENQPNAFFRLVAGEDGNHSAGAVRIDNFSVTATPIPEPATVGMLIGLAAVGAAAGGRIRRQKAYRAEKT